MLELKWKSLGVLCVWLLMCGCGDDPAGDTGVGNNQVPGMQTTMPAANPVGTTDPTQMPMPTPVTDTPTAGEQPPPTGMETDPVQMPIPMAPDPMVGDGTAGMGSMMPDPAPATPLALTSSVVSEGAMIPAMHRCEGPSPELAWTGGPAETMAYAIVFKDITPGFSQDYLHWVIYDIPATETGLPGGVPIGAMPAAPAGAKQGQIWNMVMGYNGPCAPFGMNTYTFTLHALDVATLPDGDPQDMIAAHSLESATLMITSMP